MTKEKQFVAMTHETCPICGKNTNEGILIHRAFGDLSEVHDKSTGFSKPCSECQAGIDMGAIMIIVVDQSKTSDMSKPEEWWRTGNVMGIKEEAVRKMLAGNDEMLEAILKKRVMVMDYHDAIGLPIKYTP